MRIKLTNELIPLNLLAFILVAAIVFFPSNILRVFLGIPFLLFFPGYTLMAALFVRKERMDGIERVALSFGLSIAVVAFIGLILNYTPWGIGLETVLYSIASFVLVTSIIAWFRRRRLTDIERFSVDFNLIIPGQGGGAWDKPLSIALLICILVALGVLSYVIIAPKIGEKFTEFYILGLEGKAANYPTELAVGEEGRVIVGIINQEHEPVIYRVEVRIDGVSNNNIWPVMLEHEEKWEEIVSFIPHKTGDNQKVEFLLHEQWQSEVYQSVELWIDVRE